MREMFLALELYFGAPRNLSHPVVFSLRHPV